MDPPDDPPLAPLHQSHTPSIRQSPITHNNFPPPNHELGMQLIARLSSSQTPSEASEPRPCVRSLMLTTNDDFRGVWIGKNSTQLLLAQYV